MQPKNDKMSQINTHKDYETQFSTLVHRDRVNQITILLGYRLHTLHPQADYRETQGKVRETWTHQVLKNAHAVRRHGTPI